MSVEIFYRRGYEWEDWLYLDDNGKFDYHFENDGLKFLRKGPEAKNATLTLEQALARFPEYAERITAAMEQIR